METRRGAAVEGVAEVAPCHAGVGDLEARARNPYLGATVGRVAGRTGGARVREFSEGFAAHVNFRLRNSGDGGACRRS